MIRLKLSHKLAFLVSVPLMFEIVFVLILLGLQHQAEREVKRVATSKDIMHLTHDVVRKVYEAGNDKFVLAQVDAPSVIRGQNRIVKDVAALRRLAGRDPRERQAIENFCRMGAASLELIKDSRKEEVDVNPLVVHRVLRSVHAMIRESEVIDQIQADVQRTAPLEERQWRRFVEQWLIFGLGASALLTYILAVFLHRNIAIRVETIIDNTELFSQEKELHPPDRGMDEIAILDNVFHDMATSVVNSARAERQAMAEKQTVMQMIAHDIRSPLTSLQLLLNMLAAGSFGKLTEIAGKKVEAGGFELRRILLMVSNFLDKEKLDAGLLTLQPNTVSISSLIEQAVASVSALAGEKNIEIVQSATAGAIYADGDRLIQVLINLLSNAIKFSPSDSVVTIAASIQGNTAEFSVTDQGPGIADERASNLFQSFTHSESKAGSGSGLGLYLCKEIVSRHNGEIGVQKCEPNGSVFWFRLPVDQDDL